MGWEPPLGAWDEWSQKYKNAGSDYAVGYAQGVEVAADGPCEVPPSYSNDADYQAGYAAGMVDGASGQVKEPEALAYSAAQPVDFNSPEYQRQMEEQEKEQESDENQERMYEDGSVMTKAQHDAKEARETLERLEGEMPEPQEYGEGGGAGEDPPAIVE